MVEVAEELTAARAAAAALEDPGDRRQAEHQVRALRLVLDSARQAAARGERQLREQVAQEQSIVELRAEMAGQKAQHGDQLRVLEVQSSQEKRVSMLEARRSELSESVGGYEKARQQDKVALGAMRDQVQVLDTENQELSAASAPPEEEGPLEQVLRLKALRLETRPAEELEPACRLPGPEEDAACDGCRSLQERLEALAGFPPGYVYIVKLCIHSKSQNDYVLAMYT